MTAFVRIFAAIVTGVLLFTACANFDIWPFAWFGFLPLLLTIRTSSPRRVFLLGWLAGTVANVGGFYWISHLLIRFGHMHVVPAVLLCTLMGAYQGLHWGGFAYLVQKIERRDDRFSRLPMTLLAPAVMVAFELIMPFIFPWYIAITQTWQVPVIQIAELTGPLGVTALVMMVNGALYDLILRYRADKTIRWRPAAVALLVMGLCLGFGALRISQVSKSRASAPKVKVGVVQGNIGIVEKGRARLAQQHLALHQRVSRELQARGADLVLWPESSYPYAIERSRTQDFPGDDLRKVGRGLKVPLIFGALTYDASGREPYPFNSALMINPDGRIAGRFDKNYLLIFGEHIPFYEQIPWFKKIFPEASHFAQGTSVTTFPFRDGRIGPMICYEDIIPSFARRLSELGPNLLVNITNDAWFGKTSATYEHFALSVYRSVEHRRDLVRALNTGVSAMVSATGKVEQITDSFDPLLTPGVGPVSMLAEVALLDTPRTVYAYLGNWLGWLALAFTLVATVRLKRQRAAVTGKRRRRR